MRLKWRSEWLLTTVIAAAVVTALDAFLLQESRSFFTGGFLAADHLAGVGESIVFLLGSLLVDGGLTALGAAAGLAVAGRLGLSRYARRVLGLSAAVFPLAAASAIANGIFAYLGGAFDMGLMFDLAGHRPAEFLAVASQHILAPVGVGLVGIALCAFVVRAVHRRWPDGRWPLASRPRARAWSLVALAAMVVGLAVSTGLRLERESFDNGLRRKPSGDFFGFIVSTLTDVDRDGFGMFGRPDDPAPFDAHIYPYAVDWPGNGVDEDGLGGDLPADTPVCTEPGGAAPAFVRKPTIVVFVLETFRADLVDAEIDGRPVTPVLRDLAKRGVSSKFAYSLNGYTVQSRFHLFTGSVANLRGGTSLVDDFSANGYQVAYFSGQDESFGSDDLDVGFGRAEVAYDARQDRKLRYTTFTTPGSLAVPFDVLERRIGEFLASRRDKRPLFLYVNFHDTHFPYHHERVKPIVSDVVLSQGEIGPSARDPLWRMYANTAANVDGAIGRVIADVGRAVGTGPAVVVTADHGESLYDEGFLGHGYALNDAQTRIPLIATNLPARIVEPFSQADLRDMLWRALTGSDGPPSISEAEGPPVLQYLGNIDRPRQIAFATRSGRDVFDFRASRFRSGDGPEQAPAALDGPRRDAFVDLLRTWERIRLAHASREAGSVGRLLRRHDSMAP